MLGHISQKPFTSSGNITNANLNGSDMLVAKTAGICLTLPAGVRGMSNKQFRLVNYSDGFIALAVKSGGSFLSGSTCIVIPAYGAIDGRLVEYAVNSFRWKITGDYSESVQGTWTPTYVWATQTPTISSTIGEFYFVEGACFFNLTINLSDGKGSTGLTSYTLPIQPADIDCKTPVETVVTVDGVETKLKGYIDQTDNTAANRLGKFFTNATLTDTKVCKYEISGMFEVHGFTAFTPSETWTTGTPASITKVGRFKMFGDKAMGFIYNTESADSNACSALTVAVPNGIIPPDYNTYCAFTSIEKAGAGGATYYDVAGVVDQLDGTAENRLLKFLGFTAGTDAQAVGVYAAGVIEVFGWQNFTPTLAFGTATPGSITKVGRFHQYKGICFVSIYANSADGNGATSVVSSMPLPCRKSVGKFLIAGHEKQNTTFYGSVCRIDATQAVHASRTGSAVKFTTATDGETIMLYFGGHFPVG